MKNSGKCPKCGSNDIYTNEKKLISTENSAIAVGHWNRFRVAEYICTSCGFLERYMAEKSLQDRSKMEKIKEKWAPSKKG